MTSFIFVEVFGDVNFIVSRPIAVGGDFTTDDDAVDFVEKLVDEGLFIVNFGTADNEKNRFFGVFSGRFEVGDFFFEEKAGVDGEVVFDGVGGGVGAMDDGKTVLDVEVGVDGACDVTDKVAIIGLFARVEAEILEEGDFDIFRDGDFGVCFRERIKADFLFGKKFFKSVYDGAEGVLRVFLAIGATEVGNQNDFFGVVFEEVVDSG